MPQSNTVIPDSLVVPTSQYFDPPTDPFWLSLHNTLLPLVTENDHLVSSIQRFFGVCYRGPLFSSVGNKSQKITQKAQKAQKVQKTPQNPQNSSIPQSTTQHDHIHPLFSPIRGPSIIHIMMTLASELGNELFYAIWLVMTVLTWDIHTSIPLLLLWALSLGTLQFLKDKLQLPRPGCQYYNPRSHRYKMPIPRNEYVIRIEQHYSAEYGAPSAHCSGMGLAFFNLYYLWTKFDYSFLSTTNYDIGFTSISTVTTFIVHLCCLFWLFMTPLSRLYFGVHSFLDIFLGSLLSFTCTGIIILIDSAGLISFALNSTIGIVLLHLIFILFCYVYPKHDHVWTNSSGDTALVLGSAASCSMVAFIINQQANFNYNNVVLLFTNFGKFSFFNFFNSFLNFHKNLFPLFDENINFSNSLQNCSQIISTPNYSNLFSSHSLSTITSLRSLSTLCPSLFTPFSTYPPLKDIITPVLNLSDKIGSNLILGVGTPKTPPLPSQFISPSSLNPFPYGLLSPPFLYPVSSISSMELGEILGNKDQILVSVVLGCAVVLVRAFISIAGGYLFKDLVCRKTVFKLSRIVLGFSGKIDEKSVFCAENNGNFGGNFVGNFVGENNHFNNFENNNLNGNDNNLITSVVLTLGDGSSVDGEGGNLSFRNKNPPQHTSPSNNGNNHGCQNCQNVQHFFPKSNNHKNNQKNNKNKKNIDKKIDEKFAPCQICTNQQNGSNNNDTDNNDIKTIIPISSLSLNIDTISTQFESNQNGKNEQNQPSPITSPHQLPIMYSGPPVSSTLYRYTKDLPIKYINIIDMIDKFVGYYIAAMMALVFFNPFLDHVVGLKYFLYVPGG
jgi:membrane-associated phospholipid phosphatase